MTPTDTVAARFVMETKDMLFLSEIAWLSTVAVVLLIVMVAVAIAKSR